MKWLRRCHSKWVPNLLLHSIWVRIFSIYGMYLYGKVPEVNHNQCEDKLKDSTVISGAKLSMNSRNRL